MVTDDFPADPSPAVQPEPGLDRYGRGEDGLTMKQRLFVDEYLIDMNATAAAKRAGYSPTSAHDIGYENLQKPAIVDAIGQAMAKRSGELHIDAKWVLIELASIHNDAKDDKTSAGRRDRMRVLELIGKHVDVRAFRTQLGLSGPDGGPIEMNWNLSALSDEELDLFERLLAKISLSGGDPAGASGAVAPEGHGADA